MPTMILYPTRNIYGQLRYWVGYTDEYIEERHDGHLHATHAQTWVPFAWQPVSIAHMERSR